MPILEIRLFLEHVRKTKVGPLGEYLITSRFDPPRRPPPTGTVFIDVVFPSEIVAFAEVGFSGNDARPKRVFQLGRNRR